MMKQSTSFAQGANKLFLTIARLRLLLVMFLTLTVTTNAWAETWTWNATNPSELGSSTDNTITLNGKEWETIRSKGTNQNQLQNSCIQIGSRSEPQTITLQSNAFSGKILEVSVECASYNGAHKISIQVGSTTYLSSTTTPTWTTISTKTGSGTSSGQIVISFTDGSRALYIKSISVTYEEGITEPSKLAKPTGLNVTNITSTAATLSWNTVANASSYTVELFGENKHLIKTFSNLNATTITISDLESSTHYIFGVVAVGDGSTYLDSDQAASEVFTTAPATCAVTYDANGGIGTPPSDTKVYTNGATVTVFGNYGKLTKDGYAFTGWNTEADGSGTTYRAGEKFTISANTTLYAQWCEAYWKLVTDAAELENDTRIVIAAKDEAVALSTTQNTYNRGQVEITKKYNTIILTNTVQIITLELGAIENTFAFNTGNGYLYAAGANSNDYLKTQNENNIKGLWEIAINAGNTEIVVTPTANISHNILKYNSTSDLFSCYGRTNSQKDVVIYKEVCIQDQYNVKEPNLKNTTAANNNPTTVASDAKSLTLKYSANTGYLLPETITVKMGGVLLVATTDYTWDKATGALTINVTGFYGDIDVKIEAEADPCYGFEMSTVNATSTTPNSVTLTWTEVTGATGYNVKLGTGEFTTGTGLTHTFEGLTPKTTYNWEVQAVNGTCQASQTGSITTQKESFTITWLANGQEHHVQTDVEGTAIEIPVEPEATTYACDDKVFVGWTATPIDGSTDTEPADLFTTKTAKVEEAATIYYAVFATADAGGSTTDTYDWESDQTGNWTVDAAITRTQSQGIDESYAGKINTNNTYVTYNNKVAVTNFSFDFKRTTNNENYNVYIETSTDKSTWTAVATYPMTDFGNGSYTNKSHTFDGTHDLYVRFHCYNTTATRYVDNVSITYGGTSYSDYSTICEAIPDPVWGGAVINRNSIKVDCGSMTKLNAADPNGPATISFPAATNHTLTYDITVTASERFLVSTNKTDAAKYGASVTVSPNKTGDNAGKITQNVYVVAVAPAMSDEDFTGTITLSGKQLAENQVIDVNADVTCTQYTLTLVDRGVSTEQLTKYYAGETINEAPTAPEGVCTDPIHYVFDGWAAATVAEASTTYIKVTFPYTVTGNTKFYAVYRYVEEGSGDGNYYLVENDLGSQWAGEYLIVSGTKAFDGSLSSLDVTDNNFDVTISNKTIEATDEINQKTFTIKSVEEYYTIQSKSGKYIGAFATGNLNNNTEVYDDRFYHTLGIGSPNNKALIYSNKGDGVELQTNGGRFRYYTKNNQTAVYLYKKADGTTYYTTSPVCGPHLAITEGKDIYVTGGNTGGTRDLVIAQTKVSYKATRLEKDKSTGNLPSIKALPSNIVFDNTKTKAVAVTFDEDSVRTLQSDGTYTITGNITIAYQPAAANVTDDIQVTLNANYNPSADVSQASFTVHVRSLPADFVIVAKSGDKWYALNGDMNTNAANPANGQVTLDNDANPTKATYAPCNTIYTFDGLPNTGDRTYVRFQGTDGAWLWAASGTNVGIQNNVLQTTPEGNNNAYNWKLYTQDNITYQFGNANSNRQLTLNSEKFGMYASGVQDIRILPYVEKCLYNYAPSNLKVSVLKGTYVTLTWDAVAGATKYQYSTNGTIWTDAGTEPTVTINELENATKYTYYIRAYHEDVGVSQECIDYAEITFTTADCDDVPTNITYTADLNSITVSWTAAASTATITYNTKEDYTGEGGIINNATSPYKISGGLKKNTTYYIQILASGTCASPIIPVKTEDVEVDIVEWKTDGIIVDINTDETIGITLENEISYGSGIGTEATELFFSKYYEATGNVKLVAIYNGTKNIIDLTDYTIQYGKTTWEDNYITLKDFGATKGQIQPSEEIILYSMQDGNQDNDIMDCVYEDFPDGNWVRVTSSNNDGKGILSFAGDKTIILCKTEYDDEAKEYYDNIIDVIGALIEDPNVGILPTNENTEKPSWGDNKGWVCETGLSIANDSQIGISTNRCLLVRNNTVTSGLDAVAQNIEGDFVTLCSEWKGAQVPVSDIDNGVAASCENFEYVGTFDYSDYYTKYVPMGEGTTFEKNDRNPDGTVTIPITDLYKHACSNIRIKLTNSNGEVLSDREYKVPIMITTTQGTDGQAFLDLQQNLATKEVDGEGNVIATHPRSIEEVREICKTCDVVVRDNATLTKVTDGTTNDHPQVHDVIVYEGASIVIPNGTDHNYTINSLSLRRKGDDVASAQVQGTGKLVLPADVPVTLNMRIDATNWHWFTLPYNCNIADVTWSDGTPAKYGTDWFLMWYDGKERAASTDPRDNHWKKYNGSTIEAGKGYIVGILGNLSAPNYTYELRFPMVKTVLTNEQEDKTVPVNAWGVNSENTPNNKGWNLVGNPYLNYYQPATNGFTGLPLIQYTEDPETGEWSYTQSGDIPYLVTPVNGGWSEYQQELASQVDMLPFTAYFVQVGNPGTHTDGQELQAEFNTAKRARASLIRRAPNEVDEQEEPAIVAVELTNSKGESDKTTLLIADRFTDEYEMNADFFKWFGDYYTYYTKPVLYTLGADNESRAFNALNEQLAAQPVELGMFAAQAGNYTFSLNQRSNLTGVAEVWLHDANSNTHTNLMQDDYTFSTAKTNGAGRFSLSVKMASKVTTAVDNITANGIWATTQDNQIIINGLAKDLQLWIYDATGKLLHADHTTNYQHSYSVPTSGVYFVRVNGQAEAQTIKVVVE